MLVNLESLLCLSQSVTENTGLSFVFRMLDLCGHISFSVTLSFSITRITFHFVSTKLCNQLHSHALLSHVFTVHFVVSVIIEQ